MAGGSILYSLSETYAVVKLVNKITWETSVDLNTLFSCLLKEIKINILYLDCSETSYIDSTILGTLVHFKKKSDLQNLSVIIASPSKICETILGDVGLTKVFVINRGQPPAMGIVNELPLGKRNTPSEIESLIKEAHEELIKLNEKNRELFSSVVDTFRNKK
jgi:anti-anti-sigma factor